MNDQALSAADQQAQPVVMARISCGCGFTATGFDERCNADAFDSHVCYRSQLKEHSWHESLSTFLVVAVCVFGAIVLILGEVPW